ncbi:DUF4235 domain-containing protein [Kitasatospora sp. A2-31]|uniref:DUF4235 domain-containing protein n=1 Tax=Kitasatospora sp. A2-31 TaxID=2916414 RepID=UPI001EEAFF3E|nr:DUF4235 domain-containing protein [Kitasatospora sp. A2-31]MCG6494316.1 DUF4235 domain-containing protein [Kitasatospora sp. A2-31]
MNIVTLTRRPAGLLVGAMGGGPAVVVARRVWRILGSGDDRPAKKHRTRRRALLAAAFQCAVFAVLKAALSRSPRRRRRDPSRRHR